MGTIGLVGVVVGVGTIGAWTGGGSGGELLVNVVLDRAKRSVSGEPQVYNIRSGTPYLDVTAPDDWSVTITLR
ncbi:MAG: hypothetical protein M3O34_12095 [Chloroflexota bacterium]|nr:hypothetical protein [Chloroflexota bacterium]